MPPKSVIEFQLFGPASLRAMTAEEEEFHNLLDDMKHVGDQDEWWLQKRLGTNLAALRDLRGKLSDAQIRGYLRAFQGVFDNTWWRSVCHRRRRGPAPDPLGMFGGQAPLFQILRLGECIEVFGGSKALPRELIDRLRNPSQHQQAATELEVASCFKQAGFCTEMYPIVISGSHPDGRIVVEEQTIYYEVTEESWSALSREVFKADKLLIDWISKEFGPVNGMIHFHSGRDTPAASAKSAIGIMAKQFSETSLPCSCKVDFFEATFDRSQGFGGWVGVSGLEPEPSQLVRRWVKRLFDEAKQLPLSEAGVIIGSPLFLWGTREAEAANAALVEKLARQPHTRISGIIFAAKHVEHSGFMKHVPGVVINPKAKIRCDEAIGMMAQALFAYRDWM